MGDAPVITLSPKPAPRIGMVSLGCPKALVDSERILTRLKGEGYDTSPDYAGSDAVIVNTCAFLDSAREESLAGDRRGAGVGPSRDRHRLHGIGGGAAARAFPGPRRHHRRPRL